MRTIKRKLFAALAALLCATLLLSAVFLFLPKNKVNVYAYNAEQDATVEEIYKGGATPFNGYSLKSLYSQLVDGATEYEDIKEAVDNNTLLSNSVASKNIIVEFGGIKWVAVYISKADSTHKDEIDVAPVGDGKGVAKSGDLVLTLWRAFAPFNDNNSHWNLGKDRNMGAYPSNMYGTSYIRSYALNIGSEYWLDNSHLQKGSQSLDNQYAKFTMAEAEGSVVNYLVSPRYIDWQYSQSSKASAGHTYDLNNDAWGTDTPENFYNDVTYGTSYYRDKVDPQYYTAWKDDLLWLPSVAETGYGSSGTQGLWQTTLEQRKSQNNVWWRSSGDNYLFDIGRYLTASGTDYVNSVTSTPGVCPALHLNLTKAAGAASAVLPEKPQDEQLIKEYTYDGGVKKFALPALDGATYTPQSDSGWWTSETHTITATNAGEYKVEVAPPYGGWEGGSSDPVTFTLKINKATIGVDSTKEDNLGKDAVYSTTLDKIALKLPDTSETGIFPFTLYKDDNWNGAKFEYYIETHPPGGHASWNDNISTYFDNVQAEKKIDGSTPIPWKTYSASDSEMNVTEPNGYCVFYRISGLENYETLYGYFSVHIYDEELEIKFKDSAEITKDITYGEVSHSQEELKGRILNAENIEIWQAANEAEGDSITKQNVTDKFLKSTENFKFYFKKNATGDPIYPETGKYIGVGTYYVYVEYIGSEGKEHIFFKWLNSAEKEQRPSFTVTPKEIELQIEDKGHIYGQQPAEMKIADPPAGTFVGTDGISDLGTITYTYKKQGGGAVELSSKLAAGTYTVSATAKDTNYRVTFKDGTYTVDKADYSIAVEDISREYTGEGIPFEIDDLPDGVLAQYSYAGTDGTPYVSSAIPPTDVGEYIVTITFTTTDGNYNTPEQTTANLKIEPKKLYFSLEKSSGEYTGNPHDGFVVEFHTIADGDSLTKDVDYKLQFNGSDDLPRAVGEYTVTVVLLDTTAAKNYKIQAEFTEQYNITVKYITKPTADNDNLSGEYKGAEYEVNVSDYVQGDEMSFTVSPSNKGAAFDEDTGVFSAKNVGTYTLTIKLTDNVNTQWDTGDTNDITFTIEISKAELTFELNKTSDKYSGVGQDIDVIFTGNKGELTKDSDYTLTFETTGGKLDGGLPKNVGTYTVKVKLVEGNELAENYEITTVSQTFEITQAELTFKNGTGAFNGEEHSSVTVEFVGLQNGETLAAGDYTVSFEKQDVDLSNGYPKDLGVYTMKVELVSNDKTKNYKIQAGFTATYTVANGTVDKPTTTDGVVSGEYTGENYELTVSGFVAAQMEFEISPSDKGAAFDPASGKFTAKNAGEYTLTVTPKEGYTWTEGGDGAVEFTIKINKITLTVTAEDKEVVYGAMPTYTVTYSGFVSGESAESLGYTATANSTYSFTNGIGDDFEITVNAPQTLDNYTVTTVSGTLTVTPKPITLKINDGGHSLGKQPQSEFTLTAGAGELVGSDTTAVFDGLITFYVKSNGVRQELTSELEMGEYELCADDGDYGNYTVTFTSGTYSVTRISIPAPTEDTNEYTYTGKAITYMPEGFDSLTMEIEGNGNVKTDAGTYQVKVRTADPDAIFEGYGTREIIFEFVIKPAKIVKLNDNGNVFIQEEVTGSTGNHAVMLAEKDESGKFANFDAVNGQKITIWATAPFPYVSGNMPARPEFDGRSRSAVYTDITALNTNDEEYPLTVDLRTVGKYVVYYLIEADNHEPLEGEWRVAVQPDSEVTKIIFKKAVELSYGDVPTADELFTMLKNSHSDYLEITRDGKDVAGEFLSEATGVTYGLWRKNQFGKYYDCGEYYINFVLPENSSRTVIYREGGNDSAADTNRDKLKITQRELSVKWNKLTYVISEGQPISLTELTELAALDTSNMADDGGNVTVRFELEGGGQIITAAGEYRVTAVLEGTNAKNYRFADSTTVTNTVVVTAATVPDEPSEEPPAADEPPAEEKPQTTDGKDGIPWWVWLIVGVGAALIIAAIVVAVVVIKRKKPEKEVIVRDINTDDDGFYDDADSGSGSGSDGGEDKK